MKNTNYWSNLAVLITGFLFIVLGHTFQFVIYDIAALLFVIAAVLFYQTFSFSSRIGLNIVAIGSLIEFTNRFEYRSFRGVFFLLFSFVFFIWIIKDGFSSVKTKSLAGPPNSSSNPEPDGFQFSAVKPSIKFADVVGMQDLKNRLIEAGQTIKQSSKETPRNGILLFGEPGNGKTMFAEALAGELGLKWISVSFSDFASKWVNQTTEQVVRAFRDAAMQSPCVLFIDEIDSLISDRSTVMQSDSETARTTNALLTEIVNLRTRNVILIAATNNIDTLDAAAIREKRFDFKIEISSPDLPARIALIKRTLVSKQFFGIMPDAAVNLAASKWNGYSAARITAIAEEACSISRSKGNILSGYELLRSALRSIQGRKSSDQIPGKSLNELYLNKHTRRSLNQLQYLYENTEEVEKAGGTCPLGILFVGPPGTGKTASVRALAKAADMQLISTSGNDLIADPSKIDVIFKKAKDLRPAFIFIDEADDILANRSYSSAKSVTNKLLQIMDGASGKTPDVVWVAATNFIEDMDPAALRGGRFTEKVTFELPDHELTAKVATDIIDRSKIFLDRDLTIAMVTNKLEGQSIANIEQILQAATNIAITDRSMSNGRPLITSEVFFEAFDKVVV